MAKNSGDVAIGLFFAFIIGVDIGSPSSEERAVIDAFNTGAAYQNEDGELCLRDLHQDQEPVVSCVDPAAENQITLDR